MKKKSILFLFTIFMFLFLTNGAHAYWCEYGPKYGGTGDFSAKFKIGSGFENPEVTYDKDSLLDETIENWSLPIGDSVVAGIAFSVAGKCPEYLIYFEGVKPSLGTWYDLRLGKWMCTGAKEQYIFIAGKLVDSTGKEVDYLSSVKSAIYDEACGGIEGISYLVEQPNQEETIIEQPHSCLEFSKTPIKSGEDCENSKDAGCYSCENNPYFSCLWVEKDGQNGYCNVDDLQYIKCGDSYDLPNEVPKLVSLAVNLLKIGVPIVLIVIAIITLVKALTASAEDEIKKAQKSLVKKLIISVLVFFVISIVQFVVLKVADSSEAGSVNNCMSCLLNNDCSSSLYYKTNVDGYNICTYVSGGNFDCFDNN